LHRNSADWLSSCLAD